MAKYKLKMSKTIKIKFPDGKTSTINKGTTGQSIAESISKSLAKEAIAIEVNNKLNYKVNQIIIIYRRFFS